MPALRIVTLLAAWAVLFHPLTAQDMEIRTVIDFRESTQWQDWQSVNDVVMGGVSSSELVPSDSGTALFRGMVSLENNGGFASVRSRPRAHDLNGFTGLRLHVRGDGKSYRLRLYTTDGFDGVAYQRTFSTRPDEWIAVDLPFDGFTASFRGRRVTDAPVLNPAAIRRIGVLIADRQDGAFALELRSIEAYR